MSCPQCFTGHKSLGTPTGNEDKIHGRPTYIASPPEGTPVKGIIIIVPDAFGWRFVNNKILADHYASAGDYRVYLPDFMDGKACPEYVIDKIAYLTNGGNWLRKPSDFFWTLWGMLPFIITQRFGVSYPKVAAFFKAVRENEGASLPIGGAGFCWGGKHIFVLAADASQAANGKPLMDVGFTAHPSNLTLPAEAEAVTKPLSVAIGDADFVMPAKHVEATKKTWASKDVVTEVKIYERAQHGFAVRANPLSPNAEKQAEEAEKQALDFFQKEFGKLSY